MSKTIIEAVEALLSSEQSRVVVLGKFDFSDGVVRLNTSNQSVYWDEGDGEEEYIGVGNLLSISNAEESTELQSYSLNIELSAVNPELIDVALNTRYKARPAWLYLATLNEDQSTVVSDPSTNEGPVVFFAGRMDYMSIEQSKEAKISLVVTSRLADWEKARGGRFTDSYQKTYVDATDRGFEYVLPLQNLEFKWGLQGTNVTPRL